MFIAHIEDIAWNVSNEFACMKRSKQRQEINPVKKLSGKRGLFFKGIAILLPFLILMLIEISLRIFQYGDNLDLFIEAGDRSDYLVLNPVASKKYFINQAFAPTGNSELFKKNKEKSTLRIFVLGESTTIGYPYFHNGSFHRWLLYRLMHEFPDKRFEVINISLTAVNSYTVLGFAKELVKYQPDAVLIYSGHNEYYGTLGVGSTSRVGSNPRIIKLLLILRRLRIVQLLTNLFEHPKNPDDLKKEFSGQTLMQRMVADQQIPYGSAIYKKGIEQFISNMDETLNLFNRNGIPVFISNLVSNEIDLKPFVSIPPNNVQLPGFNKNFGSGVIAFNNGDWALAARFLKSADKIYSGHALCNYYLGKLAYIQGNYSQAKMYFIQAKDLDGLRFRAPTQINDAITKLCNKYKFAHLVDSKAAFDSNSQNHIIGNGLILEHVHPNLTGYAIISNAFYEALKEEHIISMARENEMTFPQLVRTMPITSFDSLLGVYRISKLKQYWPFNEALSVDSLKIESEEEKLAYAVVNEHKKWPDAIDELYNYYLGRKDLLMAKTIMESLVLEHPTETYFYDRTANLYGKLGDYEDAAFYFRRAFSISPTFEYARTLFVIYLKIDRPNDALPYLNYAIQNNTSNLNFLPVRKYTGEIINLQKEISKDSSNLPILKLIATTYMNMGNKDGASIYVEKILKADPKNKEALAILGQIKKG
jgi:tetratricopeptide (TPR) repeat protein